MKRGHKVSLSDSEWKLMNLLWEQAPRTIMQLTKALKEQTGWSKNTVITMLNRLEAKDAVYHEEGERARQFFPKLPRADAALSETRGFLERVYEGSVSMMMDAMVSSKALTEQDIEELYEILRKAEKHD